VSEIKSGSQGLLMRGRAVGDLDSEEFLGSRGRELEGTWSAESVGRGLPNGEVVGSLQSVIRPLVACHIDNDLVGARPFGDFQSRARLGWNCICLAQDFACLVIRERWREIEPPPFSS